VGTAPRARGCARGRDVRAGDAAVTLARDGGGMLRSPGAPLDVGTGSSMRRALGTDYRAAADDARAGGRRANSCQAVTVGAVQEEAFPRTRAAVAFMKWLEANHRRGEEHRHLAPGSRPTPTRCSAGTWRRRACDRVVAGGQEAGVDIRRGVD
jgi:hypothetical protein